ncbi:uncharacterized protein LOC116133970 [Pistacia vera]|uniref:uncharacterized protein LOC116133970 n=1 Tax=Pistacia vera TaxID=55513 RepID=UPI001263A6C7|nr:uncharacterized protein LOC116133970 [Pistacia vera]
MSTTQCSESMHAFFDGYINSKTTLKQFVEQYENAVRDRVKKENEADFKSIKSWIPCISIYPMEKQFQEAYTTAKFKEFQKELADKLHCEIYSLKDMESKIEYVVKEDVMVGETYRQVPFVVWSENRCSEYILRCWRKNVFRCHTKVRVSFNSLRTSAEGERFDQLSNSFSEVADLASTSVDDCNMVMQMISDMKKKLLLNDNVGGIDRSVYVACKRKINFDSVDCTSVQVSNKIMTPRAVCSKGRPPVKRKQFKAEQIVRKRKKLLNQVNGYNDMSVSLRPSLGDA